VTAELRLGYGLTVNRKAVKAAMRRLGIQGLPAPKRKRRGPQSNGATATDLVARQFSRDAPDQLWLTDITEHPTREGKLYCCAVLDAHSRRVVGWSIDSRQATSLVTSALAMAVKNRKPTTGTVVHSDHDSQAGLGLSDERWIWLGLTEGDDHDGAGRVDRSGRDDRAHDHRYR
jgi:putative transposase